MVGAGRFERPTPCAQGRCATRLRYAPTFCALLILNHFPNFRYRPACPKPSPDPSGRGKTVTKPLQFGPRQHPAKAFTFTPHSSRNATTGSTRDALRAGNSEAAIATATRTSAAAANVTPSSGVTPYNMAAR